MNVKVFRLNSGEEILARFEETDTHWTLKDPAVLIPMQKGAIGLMPWMMYAKTSNGIQIPKTFVAFTVEPLEELKAQYDSNLNNGLVTPSKKSVDSTAGSKLKLTMD